ncbi:MAG: carboxypeptidase-like regulatory domain-containing protein, partial [Verrucomicrobiota bacterium]
MAKKIIVPAVALLLIAAFGLLWWFSKPTEKVVAEPQKQVSPQPEPPTPTQESSPAPKQSTPSEYPQISLKDKTREEAIREYLMHQEKDYHYDWKIPIRFYGKVIDQFGNVVTGADVHFQWTDLSVKGTSEANTTTDNNGSFSLFDKHGKNLGVYITKQGYYDVSRKDNQTSFEFACPATENNFYEPDSDNPVIFHMRKKAAAEALIKKSIELTPPKDGSAVTVDLLTGNQSPNGQLEVKTWKPQISAEQTRTGRVFPYDWRITLKIADGGFLEHHDVFPFEAPETGYNPLIDLSLHAT